MDASSARLIKYEVRATESVGRSQAWPSLAERQVRYYAIAIRESIREDFADAMKRYTAADSDYCQRVLCYCRHVRGENYWADITRRCADSRVIAPYARPSKL